MALTQAESGILHVDDHHRHQYHHNEVYDVEHHSRAMSYDILRQKIKSYNRKWLAHSAYSIQHRRHRMTTEKLNWWTQCFASKFYIISIFSNKYKLLNAKKNLQFILENIKIFHGELAGKWKNLREICTLIKCLDI